MPDIEGMPITPALSATSDTPVVAPPEPPAVEPPPPSDTPADGETSETGEPPAPEPAQLKKARETAQDRIQAATRERRAAEARVAASEARADKLADTLEKAVDTLTRLAPKPADPAAPDPRPAREQFAEPDAYEAALVEWSSRTAARSAIAEHEAKLAEERAAEDKTRRDEESRKQQHAAEQAWIERRAKLADDPQYADFDEVATNPDINIPMSVIPALIQAPNGPQVLYHLCKHPDEANRIAGLSSLGQAVEIGRLSEVVTQANRPPVRTPPPALDPVGARGNAGPKDPNEMTTEEWAAARAPKLAAERRASMWGRPAQ